MSIMPVELIGKFQYAYDNKWGYIYGLWYTKWTKEKQDSLVNTFKTKYGANWKDDPSAKNENKYYGALYGAKWIGHVVTDCSGLFYWAFKELGGYMYHGSNTMWNKYCTSKGTLSKGKRSDGHELKPGTAVFTGNNSNRGHVGLYVGNDNVIEASGTQAGVIITKVSSGKWTAWGELKGVDYGESAPETTPTPTPSVGSAVVNDTKVALRSAPSTSASILTRVDKGERVQLLDDNTWTKVNYQGKTGYMMTKFLDK